MEQTSIILVTQSYCRELAPMFRQVFAVVRWRALEPMGVRDVSIRYELAAGWVYPLQLLSVRGA